MNKIIQKMGLAIAAVAAVAQANAAVSWVDWSSMNSGTVFGGNVTLTGPAVALEKGNGIGAGGTEGNYNNYATAPGFYNAAGTYGGLNPTDMIKVVDSGTFTLTFDKPLVNPYIALVSVGQPDISTAVTYTFPDTISIVSQGPNAWVDSFPGIGTLSNGGKSLTGQEFSGVVQLQGTFKTLSFDVAPGEDYHGFNVGAASAVPEPSTYIAGLSALGMLVLSRRNRK